MTQKAFDEQYIRLESGQVIRRGLQHKVRRVRKDRRQLRTSHPSKLVTFGAPGRRKSR